MDISHDKESSLKKNIFQRFFRRKLKKPTREQLVKELLESQKSIREKSKSKNIERPVEMDRSQYAEMVEWKKGFNDWNKFVESNPDAKSAIKEYTSDAPITGVGYSVLNYHFRSNKENMSEISLAEKIDDLDNRLKITLSRASLHRDTVVYRKISEEILKLYTDGKEVRHLEKGDKLIDKGYMSTTLSRKKAENVAVFGNIILQIEAPKGTQAAFIDPFTSTIGELEVLFKREQRMQVTDILEPRTPGGFKTISCKILPHDAKS